MANSFSFIAKLRFVHACLTAKTLTISIGRFPSTGIRGCEGQSGAWANFVRNAGRFDYKKLNPTDLIHLDQFWIERASGVAGVGVALIAFTIVPRLSLIGGTVERGVEGGVKG
jgi:hypothetical protein